jgi:hypothetical protein
MHDFHFFKKQQKNCIGSIPFEGSDWALRTLSFRRGAMENCWHFTWERAVFYNVSVGGASLLTGCFDHGVAEEAETAII